MKLWVAIPTNGERATIALALASILQQSLIPEGIIICENGRKLSTVQPAVVELIKFLREKGVKVVVEFRNLPDEGFTFLRHELLQSCEQKSSTHVLMMDDDAMLASGSLDLLCSVAMSREHFGWASPLLLYPESISSKKFAKFAPEWEPILIPFSGNSADEVLINVCPMAATTCLLVDLKNSMNIGGFNFWQYIKDFGEDRFFTARFWGKYDTVVHRGAVCYVTSGMECEGKNWRIPVNKLFLRDELIQQLHPRVADFFKSGCSSFF